MQISSGCLIRVLQPLAWVADEKVCQVKAVWGVGKKCNQSETLLTSLLRLITALQPLARVGDEKVCQSKRSNERLKVREMWERT